MVCSDTESKAPVRKKKVSFLLLTAVAPGVNSFWNQYLDIAKSSAEPGVILASTLLAEAIRPS